MTFAELAAEIPGVHFAGGSNVEVTGIAYDSRRVRAGDLFCALPGASVDGATFIPDAVAAGAVAVIAARAGDIPDGVPGLTSDDPRAAMAYAARALLSDPTAALVTVGVTGTNAKTTCTVILQSIFNAAGAKAGRVGTVGWQFAGEGETLARTTPESPDLLALLKRMRDRGATHAVLEVTSIAIPMRRVAGFRWNAGLFTNFSQDHLDLHGSMEAYFGAKKQFFDSLSHGAVAVVNADDPRGDDILAGVAARPVTFGFERGADYRGRLVAEGAGGITVRVAGEFGELELASPYIGRFNAANVLACAATALAIGVEPDAVARGVHDAPQVRGRMERIALAGDVTAVIDYAHTPEAVRSALAALRPMTRRELIVVIGAGGDRDATKRPIMGRIASEAADRAIITSDNPRTEDPAAIVEQVIAGATRDNTTAVIDRREAIARALEIARPGDIVLVAGKGHETYQEVHGARHPFDDREEVLKLRRRVEC